MASVGTLEAYLKANVTDFKAGMDQAVRSVESVDRKMNLLSVTAGIQLVKDFAHAARAIVDFGVQFYQVGVESEANAARYRAVFGENTAALDQWVEDNRTSFGQATDDMQGMVARVANMLTPLGLTSEAAGEQATKILELAAAWSSYSGGAITAEQAAEALTKGVMGQTRGLIELGMNARMVSQIEQDMGPDTDNLAGAMGRLEEITRQSGAAMKVHEELMGGALGAQREMETAVNELKDALGELMVKLAPLVTMLADLVGWAAETVTGMGNVGEAVGGLKADLVRDMAEAGQAILDAGGDVDVMRQSLVDLGVDADKIDPLIEALDTELAPALDTVGDAFKAMTDDLFPGWQAALEDAGETVRDLGPDYDQMIEQFDRHADAVDRSTRSLQELADEQRAAVDPVFGMMDALDDAAQAQRDYSAALATGDLEAMEQAEIDAMNALLNFDTAAADFDLAEAIQTVRSMGERLHWSDEQTQGWIDRILALNNTEISDKSFTITAFMHDVAGVGPLLGGRQHGGPVYPGDAAIVGEAGPELLTVSGRGAMVTPLDKLPKLQDGGKVAAGSIYQNWLAGHGSIASNAWQGSGTTYGNWLAGHGSIAANLAENESSYRGLTPMQIAVFERMGWQLPQMMAKIEAVETIANTPKASGVGNVINVYVTVEGSIRSDRELAKVVEAELVRAVRRGGASEILS
jgi:hypothetical protein